MSTALVQKTEVSRWLVASAVMVSANMKLIDTSAVNVNLPNIAGNLSAPVDEATRVLTSYLVLNAIVLPLPGGWLTTNYDTRSLFPEPAAASPPVRRMRKPKASRPAQAE